MAKKKNIPNPIRQAWVINNLYKWDAAHQSSMKNTLFDINNEITKSSNCEFYPACLDPEANRCYIRNKTCLNIQKV
jgi:hypothetical protein